jgi:hypothetical protein
MEDEKKGKGFVIKDKRLFDESGDTRREKAKETEEPAIEEKVEHTLDEAKEDDQETHGDEHYPEVNFASFVLSLCTSVMYHFGDFPDPVSKKAERNLPAAKQTIDILTILKDKTAGNLDANEKSLLDGMLFELRMRYVKEKVK